MDRERDISKNIGAVIDKFSYPVYIVDPESKKILYANKILKEIFGYDIEGKICYKVFQNLDHPCDFCPEKYILGENLGKTYVWDFQNKRNGRWYHCIDQAILWKGKWVHMEMAIDITERVKKEKEIKKDLENMEDLVDDVVKISTHISELRDPYTVGHERRVAELSDAISEHLGLSKEERKKIYYASLLHDIGKIVIPLEILNKPGKLSRVEFSLIKQHPIKGYEILKDVRFPFSVADIVLQHHERINGKGYPYGLKGKQILLETKILSVADVVDAMSHIRPYRPALGIDKALEEIDKNKGILYDKKVAEICIKLFTKTGFKFTG